MSISTGIAKLLQNICHYFPWSVLHGASLPIYECSFSTYQQGRFLMLKITHEENEQHEIPNIEKYSLHNILPICRIFKDKLWFTKLHACHFR